MRHHTERKLAGVIALAAFLCVCFLLSSLALGLTSARTEKNRITTGRVALALDDTPLPGDGFVFEPGARIEKDITVENVGTCDVWYRTYVTETSGALAEVVDVALTSEDGILLYGGKLSGLSDLSAVPVADRSLSVGEKRLLKMIISYPESAGNEGAGGTLDFKVGVEAVQVTHNGEKSFN